MKGCCSSIKKHVSLSKVLVKLVFNIFYIFFVFCCFSTITTFWPFVNNSVAILFYIYETCHAWKLRNLHTVIDNPIEEAARKDPYFTKNTLTKHSSKHYSICVNIPKNEVSRYSRSYIDINKLIKSVDIKYKTQQQSITRQSVNYFEVSDPTNFVW